MKEREERRERERERQRKRDRGDKERERKIEKKRKKKKMKRFTPWVRDMFLKCIDLLLKLKENIKSKWFDFLFRMFFLLLGHFDDSIQMPLP